VIAAAKQSGRNRLMEIAAPMVWDDFVSGEFPLGTVYVAHPSGARPPLSPPAQTAAIAGLRTPDADGTSTLPPDPPRPAIIVAVGPEGGFTDEEIRQAAASGAQLINLGPTILRTETAAIAMAVLFGISRL
jgi:16S rRNA (uracil1498-N3)-methyltransferase